MTEAVRIWVVDDDRRMTRTPVDILSLAGEKVAEAWSVQQAREPANTEIFDCLLTDVRMSGMNGVELYKDLVAIQPGLIKGNRL